MNDLAPGWNCPADWPDEGPLSESEPSEPGTRYVLPFRWSLHYALSKRQWSNLRERHKKLFPEWDHCGCPKQCRAKTLDEQWKYDHVTHTKTFVGADFICGGCHWLKTPPFRIKTWLEMQNGLAPLTFKPPHIIDCLGWTQQQLNALCDRDLKKHKVETVLRERLNQQVQQGTAAIIPSPPERLSPQDLGKLVRPGQIMVVPWRIDLSALARYGYSPSEIVVFEQRMYNLAAKRMAGE